ncbi:MAG: hypothetical protein PHE50_06785 [Dehalococcoidales bacterium]|nr:hypothetical protein [Dehalococcoidales bacterium]
MSIFSNAWGQVKKKISAPKHTGKKEPADKIAMVMSGEDVAETHVVANAVTPETMNAATPTTPSIASDAPANPAPTVEAAPGAVATDTTAPPVVTASTTEPVAAASASTMPAASPAAPPPVPDQLNPADDTQKKSMFSDLFQQVETKAETPLDKLINSLSDVDMTELLAETEELKSIMHDWKH